MQTTSKYMHLPPSMWYQYLNFENWMLKTTSDIASQFTLENRQTDRRTNTQSDRQTSFDSSDWVGLEKIYYDGGLELYGNIYVWSIFILRLVLNWTNHHHQDGVLVLLLQWNVNRFYYTSWQIHSLNWPSEQHQVHLLFD